jgi:hypothetical protein
MTTALILDELNGLPRYACPDCGRWAYEGKAILHSKRCDYPKLQPTAIQAKRDEQSEADRLYRFAQNVKRTGLCGGKHDDVAACVARGLLNQSDAMNLDD